MSSSSTSRRRIVRSYPWPRDEAMIRLLDTLTAREQLPPGIAAILMNRTHAYREICLPVRPHEMQLLKTMDGTRKLREMLANPAEREPARSLFERLWWHDQIVFDATQLG